MYPKRSNTYGVPHPLPERDRTHWNSCWRYASHHSCAVALVVKMAATLRAIADAHELSDDERYAVAQLLVRVEQE